MAISIKRFADINIKTFSSGETTGTRGTILLCSTEATDTAGVTVYGMGGDDGASALLSGMTQTLAALQIFFDNGGVAAKVIPLDVSVTGSEFSSFSDDNVVIAYVGEGVTYTYVKSECVNYNAQASVYGTNRKIFCARFDAASIAALDEDSVPYLAVKFSSVAGAEMTIAAYLSKTNVYAPDSIFDYMFTSETIAPEDQITDAQYGSIIANHMNVDITLALAVRDCGGDLKDGSDLIDTYCLILLHQTATEQIVRLLAQKVKNSTGIAQLYAVVSQELTRYLTSGYLTTDKSWTDPTLTVTYNSNVYTIIEKGTALPNGFIVRVLPASALTAADKAAHKAPPIYVVLATQYGIRAVTINGWVI